MGQRLTGQILVLAIGLAPVVLALLTWSAQGPGPRMFLVKTYAMPVLAVEAAVIIVALVTGLADTIRRVRLPRPAAVAAAALALVMVGTIPFAPVPADAAMFTSFWVIHLLFGLSVMHLAGRFFTPVDLVRSYAIGFALFCGLFLFLLAQVRDDPSFNWNAGLPAFAQVRIVGHYAAPLAGLAAGLMALARTPLRWALAFAVATLACALALWTGSRGALIGVAAALAAGLLFAPPMRRVRAWGGLVAGLALAWLAVSNLPAPAPNMGSARIVASTVQAKDRTTGRAAFWPQVAKAVAERPVFGHGEGQMLYVARVASLRHPHNVVLQVLLAWGVVGLAAIAILAFYFARATLHLVGSGADELVPAFVAMTALAVPSLIDGSLFHVLPVSIFAACAGMIGSEMLRRSDGA